MVLFRDVAHEHPDLTIVDLAPVAAPLALYTHRMGAALGKTARIEGDDPIGLAQPLGHLTHQHPDQWPVVPWCDTDKVLQDLSLDIDPGRDCLGILAWYMRQEPLEVEMHGVRVGLGLERLLIGPDELAQTLHHLMENIGGDETIAPQFLSPLCPRSCHLFASSHSPAKTTCSF